MLIFVWILAAFVFLSLLFRWFTSKMYELKQVPHTETPEKFGFTFEEVRFPTANQRSLYGWWIPAEKHPETAPTLILVHGWSRNLSRMMRYIEHLHPLNYNLLAFDARHHGSSDLDNHSSMFKFGQDIQAAVTYVTTRAVDPEKIGLIGHSIGGAGSVYAASLAKQVKAVVTIGAPANPVDVMKYEFKRHHLPNWLAWLILKQIQTRIGVPYDLFAPVNNIAKARASFLVIHGEDDQIVPHGQGVKLSQAARPDQAEFWSIPGRGHSNCHREPGFWNRLDKFFSLCFRQENNRA